MGRYFTVKICILSIGDKRKIYKKGEITDVIYDGAFTKRLEASLFDGEKDSVMGCVSMLLNLRLNEYFVGDFGFLGGSSNVHGDFNF